MSSVLMVLGPALDQVGAQLDLIPGSFLLAAHCAFCATLANDVKDRYLLHYWLTFLAGFGGGAVSALFLMRPDEVPINFFANRTDVIWTLAWWAINYFPYNIPGRIHSMLPVRMVTKACLNVLRSATLCARVSQCVKYHPSALFAPIVMGVVGGSGGKVISEMIRGGYGLTLGRDEMSLPSLSVHSSMVSAVCYYWLVHVMAVLSPYRGKVLITCMLVLHGVLADLSGLPMNFSQPIMRVFHAVTNIPQPMHVVPTKRAKSKTDEDKKKE